MYTHDTHALGRRRLWLDLRGMQLFASNPSSIVIHDRSGQHCHQLAEKTDTKVAGKYGGVERPPPFFLGLAITLCTLTLCDMRCTERVHCTCSALQVL